MTERAYGCCYIVATPIGNLSDMTQRAIDTLAKVNIICAEDTRVTRRLLAHYGISTPTVAMHNFNERACIPQLLQRLRDGQDVALVSDAGTPLICDPGYPLVATLHSVGVTVVPIPGACALIAALSCAGLPTQTFYFAGFLPTKAAAKRDKLVSLIKLETTVIFYESKHRILDTLHCLLTQLGPHQEVAICRELTKCYETVMRGPLETVYSLFNTDTMQQKGEFVFLIPPVEASTSAMMPAECAEIADAIGTRLPRKRVAELLAKLSSHKKNTIYQWLLKR